MKRLLIAVAAVAAAVTLAACGGTAGGDNGSTPGAAPSSTATTTVSAEQIGDAGRVLVDSDGKALYASDQEVRGKVLCTGACLTFWMPVTVDSGTPTASSLTGKLGVVTRPDDTTQVTYNGKLLYSFTEDQPGQVTGDGFADAFGGQPFNWHVVHVNGAADSTGGNTTNTGPYGN